MTFELQPSRRPEVGWGQARRGGVRGEGYACLAGLGKEYLPRKVPWPCKLQNDECYLKPLVDHYHQVRSEITLDWDQL